MLGDTDFFSISNSNFHFSLELPKKEILVVAYHKGFCLSKPVMFEPQLFKISKCSDRVFAKGSLIFDLKFSLSPLQHQEMGEMNQLNDEK